MRFGYGIRRWIQTYGSLQQIVTGGVLRLYSATTIPYTYQNPAHGLATLLCEITSNGETYDAGNWAVGGISFANPSIGANPCNISSFKIGGYEQLPHGINLVGVYEGAEVNYSNVNFHRYILEKGFQQQMALGPTFRICQSYDTTNGTFGSLLFYAHPHYGHNQNYSPLRGGIDPYNIDITTTGLTTRFNFAVGQATTQAVPNALGVAPRNGLRFIYDDSTCRLIKKPDQVWAGTAIADGTPNFFRLYTPGIPTAYYRLGSLTIYDSYCIQGTCGSGAGVDLQLLPLPLVNGRRVTIDNFGITCPAG